MLGGSSYFDESLIKGVVNYGVCEPDSQMSCNFYIIIQMNIPCGFNTVPVYVYYNDVGVRYGIENNLHKQQCIIGAQTHK